MNHFEIIKFLYDNNIKNFKGALKDCGFVLPEKKKLESGWLDKHLNELNNDVDIKVINIFKKFILDNNNVEKHKSHQLTYLNNVLKQFNEVKECKDKLHNITEIINKGDIQPKLKCIEHVINCPIEPKFKDVNNFTPLDRPLSLRKIELSPIDFIRRTFDCNHYDLIHILYKNNVKDIRSCFSMGVNKQLINILHAETWATTLLKTIASETEEAIIKIETEFKKFMPSPVDSAETFAPEYEKVLKLIISLLEHQIIDKEKNKAITILSKVYPDEELKYKKNYKGIPLLDYIDLKGTNVVNALALVENILQTNGSFVFDQLYNANTNNVKDYFDVAHLYFNKVTFPKNQMDWISWLDNIKNENPIGVYIILEGITRVMKLPPSI